MLTESSTLAALDRLQTTIGVRFRHIRLLAKAMTRRHVDYNLLTLGDNQRMEFLGDTVLQVGYCTGYCGWCSSCSSPTTSTSTFPTITKDISRCSGVR